jgi:hypothetical protein
VEMLCSILGDIFNEIAIFSPIWIYLYRLNLLDFAFVLKRTLILFNSESIAENIFDVSS